MQLITNITKYLVLAVLSLSFLLIWDSRNTNIVRDSISEIAAASNESAANDTWGSIRNEFELDHQAQSSRVQSEIRKLLADHEHLQSIINAATPYIYFIYQQTRARGLPAELALIPVIESEFNPWDKSNKGASGLWQLMTGTAHELGVRVREGYDGRRNVIASTKAAMAYFNDLGHNFGGDWYLAIAAYNCGEGKVRSAIRHAGTNDFWNLHVPLETRLYVPRLLAVAEIIQHPEKYGIELPHVEKKPYFAELKVTKPVTLEKVAQTTGVSVKTIQRLNPDHKKTIEPQKGADTLLVPAEKAPIVKATLAARPTNAQHV